MNAKISQVTHHIGEVLDEMDGTQASEMEYIKLIRKGRTICSRIKQEHLTNHPLINSMSPIWPSQKLSFHFERLAEVEINKELARISLVGWLFRNNSNTPNATCVVLLERKQWYSYIEPYAQTHGIKVINYRNPWKMVPLAKVTSLGITVFLKLLTSSFRKLRFPLTRSPGPGMKPHQKAGTGNNNPTEHPTVSIAYWYRTLDLDPTKRSEFFWLDESGIPNASILLYEFASDRPLSEETKAQLDCRGIKVLGKGPGISHWQPTVGLYLIFLATSFKLLKGWLGNTLRLKWVSFYFLNESLQLAIRYAYWRDFYRTNNIQIDVAVIRSDVGKVLALDSLGGVSMSYQYTVGSFFPTTLITSGETVQFVFSPLFEQQFRDVDSPVSKLVPTGFIYDGALQQLRSVDRIEEVRNQLASDGANFILCFFDENSVPNWDHPSDDEEAAADYKYLLNWLLSDPTLGIVFKPKNSTNLFQRIASISSLIDQAMETGRCTFLITENLYGSVYPAEAALQADVCIGKLVGGSAAFEARLAGLPTALIDTEHYLSHPFHSWGKNNVVFDDWPSLRGALDRFRDDPKSYPEFGDWSPAINDLDSFRDGQASARMGKYIGHIYESLKQGQSKETAMATVSDWYSQYLNNGEPQSIQED